MRRETAQKRGKDIRDMIKYFLCATAGYVHTLEKPSKIKENQHSITLKYAILYAKFLKIPDVTVLF